MKIRQRFVSNSSSSSFVILGKQLRNLPSMFTGGIWAVGEDFGEGRNVFELDKKMHKFLLDKESREPVSFTFYQGIAASENETLNRKDLPETFDVFILEVSFHSTDSLKDLKEMFESEGL